MELKAILFDLWGTLIVDPEHRSRPRAEWRANNVRDVLRAHGHDITLERTFEALMEAGNDLSALHDKGIDLTARGRAEAVLTRLGLPQDLSPGAMTSLETAICTMHPLHKPELRTDAVQCLRSVKGLGLKTALVCNAGLTTAPALRPMLEAYGLAPLLDASIFSDELQLAKPDPRLFLDALAAIGVAPAQAAFVGDSPHNDIFGARRAGLLAVQIGHRDMPPRTGYSESERADPHAQIAELGELLPAIAALAALPDPAR